MNGTDRGKLEERQVFLRKERAAQHDFYELMKGYPESEVRNGLLARIAGELASLDIQLREVEAALGRLPPAEPAPT